MEGFVQSIDFVCVHHILVSQLLIRFLLIHLGTLSNPFVVETSLQLLWIAFTRLDDSMGFPVSLLVR